MSFNDVFKSSFLESVTQFSLIDTLIALIFSLVVGLFIFVIYKKTLTGVLYSSGLALTLVGLTTVTTLVIMAVTSNVVLSLGMVGALSIVRFRAAIKEPMEIVFLFWALASGIVIGAGMIPLAVIGSVIIGFILMVLANRKQHDDPYMLVLRCADELGEQAAMALLQGQGFAKVKAKTVTAEGIELSVQVKLKDASTAFVNQLSALEGVSSAALVSYNGEYMS
ncbi:MAG: DUF4956 domain-containing protein [Christensenellales bacterium]|jgi:uncharacterized membrane protein YhiD involved in acid resistance